MRSDAKASTAGSTMRQARGLGRILRGADATRAPSPSAKGSGAPSRRLLACLPLALLLAAVFAASAQAAPETIAEYGSGAGEVANPSGVAVDQSSGDLYVAERNGFRVSKFDSEGGFLLAFGYGVREEFAEVLQTCGPAASPPTTRCFSTNNNPANGHNSEYNLVPDSVAVDQSSGDVYVGESFRLAKFTSGGQLDFFLGKNVNKTKVAEGATQEEKDICTAASGDTCGRGSSGTGPREFNSSVSVAVDSSGVVWAGVNGRIKSFSSLGAPGSEIALAGAGNTNSLALDSGGNFYVKSASFAGIRKLEAGTGTLLETLNAANNPRTVTLDAADNIYMGGCVVSTFCGGNPYRFEVFNPAGEKISQFGAGQVIGTPERNGLAVGESAERLYTTSGGGTNPAITAVQAFPLPEPGPLPENQHVEDLLPTTVTLAADLNPEGHETNYHFEWGPSESYGESTPTETLAGEEFDSEAVEAELEELIPSTTYHFRLCATNEKGTVCGPDTAFTTLPAVAIDAQWASEVAARSAKLNAELDPLGVQGEWWIEYGTSEGYGAETAHENLPASFGDISVSTTLTGLAANTTYHYRFAASDERDGAPYTVHGEDRNFTTGVSGLGFQLPDDRAWEMVSPPNKYGGSLYLPERASGGTFAAADDGEAIAYVTLGSIEAHPESSRPVEYANALARRGPGGVWSNKDIIPPHTEPITIGNIGGGLEYRAFSEDLSFAVLKQRDNTLLSPEASGKTFYLRHNTEPAGYTPLVTAREGFNNVPVGTDFWPQGTSLGFSGATPDLSHIVLSSVVPLAEGISGSALYEWTAGQLTPVSVKPAGEGGAVVPGVFGGSGPSRNGISDDGLRVFWNGEGGSPLYVRDLAREETAKLNVVQPGAYGTGKAEPIFQGADAAGTVAFFTDTQNLTADANQNGADLYRCEVTVEGEELGCELTDLTAVTANPGESAEVGGVRGVGGDATHLYFTAKGVLDGTPNSEGESAASGQRNLYLWRQDAGIRFLATLAGQDVIDEDTSAASPSGRYFAFMSQRSLTGYDNRDAFSGELDQEVFRYDAATDSLLCASCNPSGGVPNGRQGEGDRTAVDPQDIWDGRAMAASLPEATHNDLSGPTAHRTRAMHDNGRVLFNAADSLVPGDSNGAWDVYQYEPTGLGDCTSASGGPSTSRSSGGCVSLLSSGTDEEESAFVDASEGGHDVFFLTAAQLSVTDEDHVADIYDARVDGIAATRVPRSECLGEACQGAPEVPEDKTPASASFKGKGNVVVHPDCGAIARRTGKLSQRAKRLRSHARRVHNPRAKRRMAHKAKRLSQRAQSLGKRAKRCRRANRRAGR